ncbi:hypothetical protein Tco_1135151 [Tanacetum coccineum]
MAAFSYCYFSDSLDEKCGINRLSGYFFLVIFLIVIPSYLCGCPETFLIFPPVFLPCPGTQAFVQRFLSDTGRLFLLVDITAPILMGRLPSRIAPGRSGAFRRWCAAPLSTLYPPTTSESSSGDSSERPLHSSSHSVGPSRKRCRSPVDSVPSSMPVMRSLAPTRADLLPPRKRFRDSYSSEASIDKDTEIDPIETEVDMELGIGDGDDVRDHVKINPRDVRDDTEEYEARHQCWRKWIEDRYRPDVGMASIVRGGGRLLTQLEGGFFNSVMAIGMMTLLGHSRIMPILLDCCDSYRGQRVSMIERIDRLRLENLKVRAMLDIERDRVSSALHVSFTGGVSSGLTMTNTRSGMNHAAIEEMINQRVDAALEARRVNRDLELGNGNGNGK